MVFYFIETIYFALYLMYRNKQGYELRSYLLSMAIFGVFCQASFIQLMRFGIVIAKFFTLEQFTENLLFQAQNCQTMCLIGTFWFDQLLFTSIILCTIRLDIQNSTSFMMYSENWLDSKFIPSYPKSSILRTC